MMSNNSSSLALPNPYTTLAFLPPTLADQFQAACYVYVACLSAVVWDWLASMADEYRILCKSRLGLPIIPYFLSRLGTLGYCMTTTIFQTAPVVHCQVLLSMTGFFLMLSQASTSFLFFVRVKAVCFESKVVTWFFGLAWVANFGISVSVPLAINGDHIGPTTRCIITAARYYASIALIVNTLFDTFIFLTISVKIVSGTKLGENWSARIRCFLTGKGLSWISKGLLRGGQIYYFITIVVSIVMCALAFSPNVPDVFKAMFSVPTLALPSIMACRVFRAIKLKSIQESEITSSFQTPLSMIRFTPGDQICIQPGIFDASQHNTQKTIHIEEGAYDDRAFGKQTSLRDEEVQHPSDRV